QKWSDLLRNEEKSLDRKGVQVFHRWIKGWIADDRPLTEFALEILAGRGNTYANPPANFYRAVPDPYHRPASPPHLSLPLPPRSAWACASAVQRATTARSTAGRRPTATALSRCSHESITGCWRTRERTTSRSTSSSANRSCSHATTASCRTRAAGLRARSSSAT